MLTREVETAIDIEATPDRVWEVLTDFGSYPEWNPFIVRVTGTPTPGAKVILKIRSSAGWSATNKATLLAAVPNQVLRWSARLIPIPGLVAGRHEFRLSATDGGTRLVHSEQFSGVLVPIIGGLLAKTERDFHNLNEALKKQCENG
ncbi:SRPBCC domain-containing protein [Actinomadura alba]|uniref:SRPBCC domain-containing protein n=1 Tax=Actinomadura alba TaxID=406431 RepID=A0ABR7LU88_9ACTN|nr:SRPBCC domain-containing protein [Actinomadura alba]MBC6468366.1 SRPBCC domain-containing protein [Actinomadura alba]